MKQVCDHWLPWNFELRTEAAAVAVTCDSRWGSWQFLCQPGHRRSHGFITMLLKEKAIHAEQVWQKSSSEEILDSCLCW
jgi:hypothetical protein